MVQDCGSLVNLIKSDGWDKDSQDMDKFWRSKRKIDAQMTPTTKEGGSLDADCGQNSRTPKSERVFVCSESCADLGNQARVGRDGVDMMS